MTVSYLTGPLLRKGPSWIGMCNYCRLLNVSLPAGEQPLQTVLCQEPSARPLADQIRVPLRLTSWLRRTSRVPSGNIVALLQLSSAEMIQQVGAVLHSTARDVPAAEEVRLSARAQDTSLAPMEEWLSQLARNLLQLSPLPELMILLRATPNLVWVVS